MIQTELELCSDSFEMQHHYIQDKTGLSRHSPTLGEQDWACSCLAPWCIICLLDLLG